MKSTNVTPAVNGQTNGQNGNKATGFSIKPAAPVPVSELIEKAKAEAKPDEIKQPTTYPTKQEPEAAASTEPQPDTREVVHLPAPKFDVIDKPTTPEPQPAAPAPVQPAAPARSRSEEIEFQVEKARQLQLVNTQLQSLKTKRDELKQFSFAVDRDDDHSYGRLVIFDSMNREFQAKNHGLAALVVEQLRKLFEEKIEEKETELLTVSRS